ncbi:unnamed protein product, partial [Ectocarpus fasciculatus]
MFRYTGSVQQFVVPSGVHCVSVSAYGGQGGTPLYYPLGSGGKGAFIRSTFNVTPGDVLDVHVGGEGFATHGGWNGGGPGGYRVGMTSYGGGASDIRPAGGNISTRLLVAGGGGGGAYSCGIGIGGYGGCLLGGNASGDCALYGGRLSTGGNQSYGGVGGNYVDTYIGTDGSLGMGGNAAKDYGSGGGGGYYGGGGGGACPGGGGSSFTSGMNGTCIHGSRSGNGLVVIDYQDGACGT